MHSQRFSSHALAALVGTVVVSIAVAGLQAPAEARPAAAAPVSAAPAKKIDDTARPDSVSARVTARTTGHRVEDLSQRTETTRVYANPDGTWTSETADGPESAQDDTGVWHDIDTTVVTRDGALEPKYAAADLRISDGGDKVFAAMTQDGKDLEWRWPTVLPTPVVDGDTVTYAGVAAGGVGDLVVTANAAGFSYDVVLHEQPTVPVEVAVPVATDGATLKETADGSLTVTTKGGDPLVTAAPPVMYDAQTNADGDPTNVVPVDTTVTKPTTGPAKLVLSADEDFLSDPDTVYPVTVDPTFNSSVSDGWIQYNDYTTMQGSGEELRVGTKDGGTHKARTFMHFNTAGEATWAGKQIISASLILRNFDSYTCTSGAIRASRLLVPWGAFEGQPGLTWSNQPSGSSEISTTDPETFSPAYGGPTASCSSGDDATWDATAWVKIWAADPSKDHGVRLAAVDETSNNTYRRYRSANYQTNTALRPRLVVNWNTKPWQADNVSVPSSTRSATINGVSYQMVTTAAPSFASFFYDWDAGDQLYTVVEIHSTPADTGLVGTCRTTPTSGTNGTCQLPANQPLPDGTYYARATTTDGDAWTGWNNWYPFIVDTLAPTLAVTASSFTNGKWTADAPASNTFTFNGASDVTSMTYSLDGGAATPKTPDANGDATLAWLPAPGRHTLSVTATDRAGNTTTTPFTFGVGSVASFGTPAASTRSTGVFPIQAFGPPNASTARLSWRYAGQSSWSPLTGVKTTDGTAWTTGTITTNGSGSSTPALVWDATAQNDPATSANIAAPALIELRACFDYTDVTDACTKPQQVQLVPSAFGDNFPVTQVGPASVALFTGEMSLSESDAADTAAGVGRTFSTFDPSTTQVGPFGPGWSTTLASSGDTTSLIDHRTQDGSFVLVSAGNASQTFTTIGTNGTATTYAPVDADDGSRLVVDGSTAKLTRPFGAVTAWNFSSGSWLVDSAASSAATASNPGAQYTYNGQYLTWIAETAPGVSTTCTLTTQSAGCRGLKISYTGTGTATRVSKIERLAAGAATVTLAQYTYDAQNRLSTVCDPRPAQQLCTTYTYTSNGGRTLLASEAPPGQAAWRFGYDSTGRLATVKRQLDPNTNSGSGDATWTVVYDLPTTSAGLPPMSATDTATWGEIAAPTKVFVVFGPNKVPAGATPTSAELPYASLWYTDAAGATSNTAVHGNVDGDSTWLIDTAWHDQHGNVVRRLDGAGRYRALAAQQPARIGIAEAGSTYTTYNSDGSRVEDEYGPAHTATLKDGTSGQYRSHTAYVYDDEAPDLGGSAKPAYPQGTTSFGLVVEARHSAADVARTQDYDTQIVRNEYAPVVDGDGNGWQLGVPTRVKTKLDADSWSIQVTRYDSAGRQIEIRQPGGGANAAGAGNDAQATVMSYYGVDASDPDCRTNLSGHTERAGWVGLLCKTEPAGQPDGPSMPVAYVAQYNGDLQPTRTEETSGGTTRVTSTTYDRLGRPISQAITDGSDTSSTDLGYDPSSGLPTSATRGGDSITTAYDTWARRSTYTDATGLVSTTTYTSDDQIATLNDGSGTETITYDGISGEHRRLATGVDTGLAAGVRDTFGLTYDATGAPAEVTYPNGMVAAYGRDEAGIPTDLQYTDASGQSLLAFGTQVDVEGRVLANSSPASTQELTYDALGRLTKVEDTRDDACTTRTYGFDAASDRTSFNSYSSAADGACQSTTPDVSRTNSYDAASRLRNPGYTYDDLGRTLTTPAADTAPGAVAPLTATYYANDMVKTLTQDVSDGVGGTITKRIAYGLDPAGRVDALTNSSNGTETDRIRYRFSDDTDLPSIVQTSSDAGTSWTTVRYLSVPALGMAASVVNDTLMYQLSNLHGDVVAVVADQPGQTTVASYVEADEFGRGGSNGLSRYGWLGAEQRSGDTIGGLLLMGSRMYNPGSGRFLSRDQVLGGNENAYVYPTDPVNKADPSGKFWIEIRKWRIRFSPDGWKGKFGFSKSETKWIAGLSVVTIAGSVAAITGNNWIVGGVVAAIAYILITLANKAVDQGACLRYRWWTTPVGASAGYPYVGSCKQSW